MELEACPFCGSRAKFGEDDAGFAFVECTKCRACVTDFKCGLSVKIVVAKKWNNRVPDVLQRQVNSLFRFIPECSQKDCIALHSMIAAIAQGDKR